MVKSKILLFDIETTPLVSYTWGMWEQNVIEVKNHWYMLCFAYKWLGEKTTKVSSIAMCKQGEDADKTLVKELWNLFNEAEVIIAHNGDEFDIKKVNARFAHYKLPPPSPYKTVDTKKVAKRYFRFDSNKLDNLGEYLGLGRKLETGGFDLWLGCMSNDLKSWELMEKYNKQDVVLLEKVYLHMRPWMTNHPNMNLIDGLARSCPNCGHDKLQKRGFSMTRVAMKQRYQCKSCSAWCSGESVKLEEVIMR